MRLLGEEMSILRIFLACLLFASALSASTRSKSGKKRVSKEVNICDIEGYRAPVYCYCDNSALRSAATADCWVLSAFEVSDPIWSYFTSQLHLQKITFTVRATGSLEFVPTQMLRQLKNLNVVIFQYAKIDELAEYAFTNLPNVSTINLSRNKIVTLRKHAFENMRNLSVVNLDENRITEISRDIFVNLPVMRSLLLNHNNISILHDKAFKHLTTLQELELFGNQINVVTRDCFHGLRNLVRLDLRNNLISMIGDRSFAEMPSLQELELDQNEIEYISEKALDSMRNLRKLRLSENKLVTLEPDFLAGSPGIYFLDLRDNALRTMTFDNIKPIVTNLYNSTSHFYLNGNRLICDCKLAWIWGLRNETKNAKLKDALEELTCFLESNNATLKINSEDREWSEALENAPNSDQYLAANLREGNTEEEDAYMGDDYEDINEDGYEDSSSNSDSQPKVQMVEGKLCLLKNLFELKLEELPCPEPSREDLMASEQPSSRHENAPIGSSIWFSSSSKPLRAELSVLACSALLVLAMLST